MSRPVDPSRRALLTGAAGVLGRLLIFLPLAALLLAAASPAFAQVKTITVPLQQPGASAPAVQSTASTST